MILLEGKTMAIKDPLVRKIFDDLDRFRDYCRYEGKVFKEASLYKKGDRVWESYMAWSRTQKKKRRRFN
tara:strand:+ start:144 stop:350 length:207 start_codon:yes stop_codon:yes gene_type:complete